MSSKRASLKLEIALSTVFVSKGATDKTDCLVVFFDRMTLLFGLRSFLLRATIAQFAGHVGLDGIYDLHFFLTGVQHHDELLQLV